MATGEHLKRDGRPSMLQLKYLLELKKLQPVKRGFQVLIAEACNVSTPALSKGLKKAVEQGILTKDYKFTEYGKRWIASYENLIRRLGNYLSDLKVPLSEKERHIRMMVEEMDPYLVESILSEHENHVRLKRKDHKNILKDIDCGRGENEKIPVRIAVYRMTQKKDGESPFSMGNRAFHPLAELRREDGETRLFLLPCEMQARSRLDGKFRDGHVSSLKYEHDCELKVAERSGEKGGYVKVPLDAFRIHMYPGGEIKGILPITVTCSVGNGHMPESTAILVFWM